MSNPDDSFPHENGKGDVVLRTEIKKKSTTF